MRAKPSMPARQMQQTRRCQHRQSGQSLVEFAVVTTLLLSFIFGVIDFSRALYTYHFVSNAARQGTRYAIVHGAASPSPATQSNISTYLKNTPLGIDPNKMTVTATWPVNNQPGSVVQVTVTYNFSFIMPFLPMSGITMQSSSQMVISQ